MKIFSYNATDMYGTPDEGIILADTVEEAILKLIYDKKTIITINEIPENMVLTEIRLRKLKMIRDGSHQTDGIKDTPKSNPSKLNPIDIIVIMIAFIIVGVIILCQLYNP